MNCRPSSFHRFQENVDLNGASGLFHALMSAQTTFKPGEIWLSVDLSAPIGSTALYRWDGERAQNVWETLLEDTTHSESFLPALYLGLEFAKIDFPEISRFITTDGPGSFTGLRIAMSTLQAFVLSNPKPTEVLCAPEIRLLSWLAKAGAEEKVAVVTHGTSTKFTLTPFRIENGRAVKSDIQQSIPMSEAAILGEYDRVLLDLQSEKTLATALGSKATVVPCTASLLAEFLPIAQSRKTYEGLEEIAAMTPQYVGSDRFS